MWRHFGGHLDPGCARPTPHSYQLLPLCRALHADPKHLKALKITPEMLEGRTLMRGRGCDHCNGSGYKGRMGIYELMVMNGKLRTLALKGRPPTRCGRRRLPMA